MATRSFIGRLNTDVSVTGIYCHYDGYPEGVGKVLSEHYTDPDKVDSLMSLGDLSVLGPELGEKHTFGEGVEAWTVAYGRDRGDADSAARTYSGSVEVMAAAREASAAHVYLFNGKSWRHTAIR